MTTATFLQSLPEKTSPEALEGVDTNFHFDIEGESGGQYTVQVKDGQMQVQEGFYGVPRCIVSAKDKNFLDVLEGRQNATMAVMMGKIKISNLGEMMKYAKMFDLM